VCALLNTVRQTEDWHLEASLVQRPACVLCVDEAVLACAKGRLVSPCTPERTFRVEKMGDIWRFVSRGPSGAILRRYLAIFGTSIAY
jgi:hypothetical protein